ncbi:hypothetical protein [Paraflavitalea speifideaquila]|uniref:hypothetical protein n=1 Tax=Paraflavitalea speifideaquila TaxID=3076558 RepID=UPI0028EE3639|nr:hypothetical protein [Paraflavitalea speifideiaquila]
MVGIGVKLLHQGATKETIQQAGWHELERLGYKTEWPQWELPPELAKWKEEENARHKMPVQRWMVNEKGQLVFDAPTLKVYYQSDSILSPTASGYTYLAQEVAMPPPCS